jgi:hypothetical protein
MNARKMKMVTVSEFVAAITGITRRPFAGLCGCTAPKLTQKDRTDHARTWAVAFPGIDRENVRKITNAVVMAGPDYGKMVVAELAREGKDESEYKRGTSWHEGVPGVPCLRRHKVRQTELYFWAAFVQKVQRPDGTWMHIKPKTRFVDITTGANIDRAALENFLPTSDDPQNQGTDEGREVIVRTYKLESVRSLTVNGIAYVPMTK